jgi:hypothetical protein
VNGPIDHKRKSPDRATFGPTEVRIMEALYKLNRGDDRFYTRVQIRKTVRFLLEDVSDNDFRAAYNELSCYSRRFRRVLAGMIQREPDM